MSQFTPIKGEFHELDSMRMGVTYKFPIKIRQYQFMARPLSNAEFIEITQEVVERMMNLKPEARNRTIESSLLSRLILVRSSTSDVGVNDPKIQEAVIERFTSDELAFAYKQYVSICDKVNPSLENLPNEEILRMVEALKKSPLEAIELSFLHLVNIVRFLLTNDG